MSSTSKKHGRSALKPPLSKTRNIALTVNFSESNIRKQNPPVKDMKMSGSTRSLGLNVGKLTQKSFNTVNIQTGSFAKTPKIKSEEPLELLLSSESSKFRLQTPELSGMPSIVTITDDSEAAKHVKFESAR